MKNKRKSIFIIMLMCGFYGYAQEVWKLKTDKDNIQIYSKSSPNSKIKTLKVVCTIDASLSQVAAVMLDIVSATDWIYRTKSAIVQKEISPSEIIYYSEIDMPWPLSNRDFIVRINLSQDTVTKALTMSTQNLPNYIPEKKDIVRVRQSEALWIFKSIGKNKVTIEYTLVVDPGGAIPVWLVNLFSTKGPFECFKNLKEQINKPVYSKAKFSFIKD